MSVVFLLWLYIDICAQTYSPVYSNHLVSCLFVCFVPFLFVRCSWNMSTNTSCYFCSALLVQIYATFMWRKCFTVQNSATWWYTCRSSIWWQCWVFRVRLWWDPDNPVACRVVESKGHIWSTRNRGAILLKNKTLCKRSTSKDILI